MDMIYRRLTFSLVDDLKLLEIRDTNQSLGLYMGTQDMNEQSVLWS